MVFNWTQWINYYKSSLRPHDYSQGLQDQNDGSASVAATCLQNGGFRRRSGTSPTQAARIRVASPCQNVQMKFLHHAELLIHIPLHEHDSQHDAARMCPV